MSSILDQCFKITFCTVPCENHFFVFNAAVNNGVVFIHGLQIWKTFRTMHVKKQCVFGARRLPNCKWRSQLCQAPCAECLYGPHDRHHTNGAFVKQEQWERSFHFPPLPFPHTTFHFVMRTGVRIYHYGYSGGWQHELGALNWSLVF